MPPLGSPEPGTSGKLSTVCDACNTIHFKRYLFHKMSKVISLLTGGEIVQSEAYSFCRLVVRSLRRYSSQTLLHPNDKISLNNNPSWELGVETSPYDRLKSEAYSNKLDLRSMAKESQDFAHRFVISVEGKPEVLAYIQYLALSQDTKEGRQFFGRFLGPDKVSMSLLRSWVRRCEKWHQITCEEDGIAGRGLPRDLRLIDVESRMIIVASHPKNLRYLTLSYAWGTEEMECESGMNLW